MATLESLAEEYAVIIKKSSNKNKAADNVIHRIINLRYTHNNQPLLEQDTLKLLELLREELLYDKVLHKFPLLEKSDNINYLQLVNYINSQVKGEK